MRIAVIGLGKMGQTYIEKLRTNSLVWSVENIVGVDSDPARLEATAEKYPTMELYNSASAGQLPIVDAAIIATNTPSHHTVMRELLMAGVRNILCEKPLAIDMAAVNEVLPYISGAQIFTGFQINFSATIKMLVALMHAEKLVLTEANVLWGKRRYMDLRPTPGDLEDETVHGMGVVHLLAGVNQKIKSHEVVGTLTYPSYVNKEVQRKAYAADSSYPINPNASSRILESILTDRGQVEVLYMSSFVYAVQVRKVGGLLESIDGPRYAFEINFDVPRKEGGVTDVLTLTPMMGEPVDHAFMADNIGAQTKAFLEAAAEREIDSRLVPFEVARRAVAFREAVLKSDDDSKFTEVAM